MVVRHAYQTLLDPVKRRAYDLFGPASSTWKVKTEREFLLRGVGWGVSPGYLVSFIALQAWSLLGRGGKAKYVISLVVTDIVAVSSIPRVIGIGDEYPSSPVPSDFSIPSVDTFFITTISSPFVST